VEPQQERPKLRVVEKSDVLDLSDFVEPPQPTVDFSHVVGLSKVKKQIERKIIMPYKKPTMYQRYKKKVGGEIIVCRRVDKPEAHPPNINT